MLSSHISVWLPIQLDAQGSVIVEVNVEDLEKQVETKPVLNDCKLE